MHSAHPEPDPMAALRPPARRSARVAARIMLFAAGIVGGAGLAGARLAAHGSVRDAAHPAAGAAGAAAARPGLVRAAAAAGAADAANAAPGMVLLPALGCPFVDDGIALVSIQNTGAEAAKAVLVVFDALDDPGPRCAPPVYDELQCTGLITPGGAWVLSSRAGSFTARGGVVFSLTARRLSEIGAAGDPDDLAADAICAALRFHVSESCEGYARFRAAWSAGEAFAGIPLDRAVGGPLAVHVLRGCESMVAAPLADYAAVVGVAGAALGTPDPRGRYRYRAAPLHNATRTGAGADRTSVLHLQNAGAVTATVTVEIQLVNACAAWRPCAETTISPGATRAIDIDACAIRDRSFTAAITSSQPLAVAVDATDERGGRTLHNGAPQAAADAGDPPPPAAATGVGVELAAPVWFDDRHGWDATVTVQNHSDAAEAVVDVAFLDRGGETLRTERRSICAGGAESATVTLTDARPGRRLGSVRVRSVAPPGGEPAPVSAVVEALRFADVMRTGTTEAFAANLVPAAVPASGGAAGAAGAVDGTAVIALPAIADAVDTAVGVGTEVVVANRVAAPGWTDVAVLLFDQNAVIGTLCRRLGAGAVLSFDVSPYFTATDTGFVGSAVVSATAWSHPRAGDPHRVAARDGAVDLGAAVVTRVDTLPGEDVPGDETAVAEGVGLAGLPPNLASLGRPCGSPDPERPRPPTPAATAPPPTAEPTVPPGAGPPRSPAVVMLPAFTFEGQDDVCRAAMVVHNRGADAAKGLVVFWSDFDSCAPDCLGPVGTTCTALLAPGAAWDLPAALTPGSSPSAAVYGFSDRTLGDLGVEPGSTITAADAACTRIRPRLVRRDCVGARAFHLAYLAGADYADLPLGRLYSGAIDVTVTRECPGDFTPGQVTSAVYTGLPRAAWLPDGAAVDAGVHTYAVNPVFADVAGFNTALYLQNAGLGCATVTLSFRAWGDCLGARTCRVLAIAPGAAYPFDASHCVGPDWSGSVVLTSTEPLAIAADRFGRDLLFTHSAVPGDQPFDLDGNGTTDAADGAVIDAALGTRPGMPGWRERADLDGSRVVDAADHRVLAMHLCRPASPAAPAPPPADLAPTRQVLLPTLLTGTPSCEAVVSLQNVGDVPSKAVLVLWKAGVGSADCAPPARVECTGLIAPGRGWTWISTPGADRSGAVASGSVFAFTARTFEELGLSGTGVVADAVCARLQADLVGDCEAFARFRRALDGGGAYAGWPMARVLGGRLVADVRRTCVSPGDAALGGGLVALAYEGVDALDVGRFDTTAGGYTYGLPLVFADKAGFNARLFVQNAGLRTADVELWLQAQGQCTGGTACQRVAIAPGATAVIDATTCVGPDWQGSARLRATQPLAVVGEVYGRGTLDTVGTPLGPAAAGNDRPARGPSRVAYGPLVRDPEHGWDSGVVVQNASSAASAMVEVAFADASGTPFGVQQRLLCPGGVDTFFVPLVNALAGDGETGSVRVVSRAAIPGAPAPPVVATALLARYSEPQRSEALDLLGHDLVPESAAFVWPAGAGAGGTHSGTAVIALPDVADLANPRDMTEIVVTNLVPVPGRTDVDITLVRADGAVATVKRSLGAGATVSIDVRAAAAASGVALPASFRGSAVVSATYWDHAVIAPDGRPRPLVGLAAAVVRRGRQAADVRAPARASVTVGRPLWRAPDVGAAPPTRWNTLWLPYAGLGGGGVR